MLGLSSRFENCDYAIEKRLIVLLLIVFAITSDLVEHLNRYHNDEEALFEVETIINGDNKRPPSFEQYYQCDTSTGANCQTTVGRLCELYPTSNSHYDLIVSIRPIPYGETNQNAQSFRGDTVFAVGESTRISRNNSEGLFCQQDNDNQEASNESQESRNHRWALGSAPFKRLISIISHSAQYSMQPKGLVWSNRIKPAGYCNTRFAHLETQLKEQPNRRKWSPWFIIGGADAIRLVRLDAPQSIQAGQQLKLKCLYETRGDKLQSLAWYRNGREFYRFQPFERRQPVLAFNSTGVHVDISKSRNHTVYLTNTTLETSGRYRCEATGTTFQEAKLETYIEVLPASSSSARLNCHRTHMTTAFYLLIQAAYILITYSSNQIKLWS